MRKLTAVISSTAKRPEEREVQCGDFWQADPLAPHGKETQSPFRSRDLVHSVDHQDQARDAQPYDEPDRSIQRRHGFSHGSVDHKSGHHDRAKADSPLEWGREEELLLEGGHIAHRP